jgi:hypothetical protein
MIEVRNLNLATTRSDVAIELRELVTVAAERVAGELQLYPVALTVSGSWDDHPRYHVLMQVWRKGEPRLRAVARLDYNIYFTDDVDAEARGRRLGKRINKFTLETAQRLESMTFGEERRQQQAAFLQAQERQARAGLRKIGESLAELDELVS